MYKMDDTKWQFTSPVEGEVDSVEKKQQTLKEIDAALITPDNRKILESGGKSVIDSSGGLLTVEDSYLKSQGVEDCFVTEIHKHPTPQSVPQADHATEADHAERAIKLTPGANINGHFFDGTSDVTIGGNFEMDDVPGARRQFWGKSEPSQYGGFPKDLRDGDIYVMVYD